MVRQRQCLKEVQPCLLVPRCRGIAFVSRCECGSAGRLPACVAFCKPSRCVLAPHHPRHMRTTCRHDVASTANSLLLHVARKWCAVHAATCVFPDVYAILQPSDTECMHVHRFLKDIQPDMLELNDRLLVTSPRTAARRGAIAAARRGQEQVPTASPAADGIPATLCRHPGLSTPCGGRTSKLHHKQRGDPRVAWSVLRWLRVASGVSRWRSLWHWSSPASRPGTACRVPT